MAQSSSKVVANCDATIYRTTTYKTDYLSNFIKPSTGVLSPNVQWNDFMKN